MKKSLLTNNRGIALLVTLTIITVLIVITMALNRRARATITSVVVAKNRSTLNQMAISGIQAAMAILVEDKLSDPPSGYDSLQENWADPETLNEIVAAIPFEEGEVAVSISDELSKIQVNTMVKFPKGIEANNPQLFLWDRFITLFELTGEENLPDVDPRTIVNSIKDWLDSGDDDAITGLNGAENDYYQSLDPPYTCKNGPIAHLDELILINGIAPELFYGLEGLFGITDYVTTTMGPITQGTDEYFAGKININTADLPIIAALLPEGSEILAPNILEYRDEMSDGEYVNEIKTATWYKNAPGCNDITIDEHLITTFSDFFLIKSQAVKGELNLTISAIIQRVQNKKSNKWECKVLSWHSE